MDHLPILISTMENPSYIRIEPLEGEHRMRRAQVFNPPIFKTIAGLPFVKTIDTDLSNNPTIELIEVIPIDKIKDKIEHAINEAFPHLRPIFKYRDRRIV
jgi:hypothetical protein